MHAFVCTNNRVNWTGRDTQGAANAVLLINHRNPQGAGLTAAWIDWFGCSV
jgi:hypothetical protein